VNVNGYLATFTSSDSNYMPFEVSVTVIVTQLLLDAPTAFETSFVYDGNEKTLSFTGFDDETMTVIGNAYTFVGDHTAVITLIDNVNCGWKSGVQEVTIEWTIISGEGIDAPEYEEPKEYTVVYDPTRTLADLVLPKGWTWNDGTICPTVDVNGYFATFTPDDVNYGQIEKMIIVTVTPLLLDVPVAYETSFVYDGKEKTLSFTGFDDDTMTIDGNVHKFVGDYTAMIGLIDSLNYGWKSGVSEVIIEWTIISGEGIDAPEYEEPKEYTMVYDPKRTLADLVLPDGWAWNDDTVNPTVDVNGYFATFTPDDVNYGQIEKEITVIVIRLLLDAPTASETSFVYDGNEKTLSFTGFDDETMMIDGNVHTDAGNYIASIQLIDNVNYGWSVRASEVTIPWSIASGEGINAPDYVGPGTYTIVYGPSKTLADLVLPDGWTWNDDTVNPTVNVNGYLATFTSSDSNYMPFEVSVIVTVTPLLLDVPTADVTSFAYSGSPITLDIAGIDHDTMIVAGNVHTDAGSYVASIQLIDGVNYGWMSGTAEVTIAWEITAIPVYSVTVTSNEGGYFEYRLDAGSQFVPLTGQISVQAGTFVEIKATADDGYSFAWNDSRASGDTISFIVTSDENITGIFSQVDKKNIEIGIVLILVLLLIASTVVFFMLLGKKKKKDEEKE
jgi:hypothetical protein